MPPQFSPFEKCHCNSQNSSKIATFSQWHFFKDENCSVISWFCMNCSGINLINPYNYGSYSDVHSYVYFFPSMMATLMFPYLAYELKRDLISKDATETWVGFWRKTNHRYAHAYDDPNGDNYTHEYGNALDNHPWRLVLAHKTKSYETRSIFSPI